jgi:lysophospholipase L1-like esterase
MAAVPAGVRLEVEADCAAVEVAYRTGRAAGHRAGSGSTFALWSDDRLVDEEPAVLGAGTARLRCAGAERATIYLPEGMDPRVTGVGAVDGTVRPAPRGPLWACYGDSIAEGWVASSPAGAWPAIVARRTGLDLVNMGYAGAARGELPSAEHVASLPASLVTIAYGTNCWSRIPFTTGMLREGLDAFLRVVRGASPDVPIVVISPVVRPEAERTRNALGATLGDLRRAMEEVAGAWAAREARIGLVRGRRLIGPDQLADPVHPNDDGHRAMADAIQPALERALQR